MLCKNFDCNSTFIVLFLNQLKNYANDKQFLLVKNHKFVARLALKHSVNYVLFIESKTVHISVNKYFFHRFLNSELVEPFMVICAHTNQTYII